MVVPASQRVKSCMSALRGRDHPIKACVSRALAAMALAGPPSSDENRARVGRADVVRLRRLEPVVSLTWGFGRSVLLLRARTSAHAAVRVAVAGHVCEGECCNER